MSEHLENQEIKNLKEIIYPYIIHWKFFIISIILCLSIYVIYINYTKKLYKINTTLIINDEKENGLAGQISSFENLGLDFGGSSSSIDNELNLLSSRNLISKVVKNLNLNITYYNLQSTRKDELYENLPIKINFLDKQCTINNKIASITIKKINSSKFELIDEKYDKKGIFFFGEAINCSFGNIIITPTYFSKIKNYHIRIKLNKYDKVVTDLINSITIEKMDKESDILSLSTQSNNINKGKAILKELVELHIEETVDDKNQVSKNSLEFINERIEFITNELSDVESNVSSFKSENKIFDLTANASMFFENENENRKNLAENDIQLKLSEFILDHLKNSKNDDLIPYNIGISNEAIDELVRSVNNIIIEKNKLLVRSSEKNPIVQNLESQILSLKNNLKESLINQKTTLKIKSRELQKTNAILDKKLTSAPEQEKDFREFSRQQQIKETLYLFLLHKREETAISLAVGVSNIKLIDPPYSDGNIVSPKKQLLLLASILIGLIIPICIIYIIKLFDTKIHNNSEIINLGIPYIGDIPNTDSKTKLVVGLAERSSVAEAFRLLRTNVNFLIPSAKDSAKSIFITSTISNEGKSFIALNLAATLGLSGKKVALLGLDLRAPKILQYINEKKAIGITSFIVDSNISLNDISIKIPEIENLTIIPSGPIPPNPAELLMSDRLSYLFDEVKEQFDYIVVDTAPVGLVADSLLLNKYADMFIYVARANFLDKRLLNIAQNLHDESKLKNMSILLNCSDYKRNYGYAYSYGYGDDSSYIEKNEKSWFHKIWKK
jgi:tyrosine-protein kinase Etk/Wzc